MTLAEDQNTQPLVSAIQAQCIDFKIDHATVAAIAGKKDVLLALFQCLQDNATTVASDSNPATNTTQVGTAVDQPTKAPMYAADTQAAQKAGELLRTLMLAPSLRNEVERQQTRYENRRLLVQIIRDNIQTIDQTELESWREAGLEIPDWLPPLLSGVREAHPDDFPTLTFDVSRRTDFYGSIDERGIKVFMSLFLVEHTPEEVDRFNFEAALIYPHVKFPYTYKPDSGKIELHRLENTEVTRMRLQKALEDYEALDMIPGKWGIRIQAYTGFDRIRADYSHYFTLEAGKDYEMSIGWKTGGDGIKRLQFDVEPQ